ncbi:hypothetical protein SAMN02745165_02166 [Malonomonas rubra DSM 5091]|uniref:Uncharacterized protein n=1 Tax=Malonomonas rubra DSM 5091 TaxID=1122189 RepID=A0A1M6IM48_MALRU|nr:hypothetical protein [Malonomonas rubra]SHJ35477.1 hypothetical protein SAMN02745165_02166 [Malonomonas rubra DSM 5091]
MTAPRTIHAIAEINRRAEEYGLKVRSELFRIGCAPNRLRVVRQGPYLQLRFGHKTLLGEPCELLLLLKRLPIGIGETEVWNQINERMRKVDTQKHQMRSWGTGMFLGGLILLFLFLLNQL